MHRDYTRMHLLLSAGQHKPLLEIFTAPMFDLGSPHSAVSQAPAVSNLFEPKMLSSQPSFLTLSLSYTYSENILGRMLYKSQRLWQKTTWLHISTVLLSNPG